MAQRDYEDLLHRALFLDRSDPVAAWAQLRDRHEALVDRLSTGSQIRIEAPGTDLRLDVSGRTWINSDGRRNMPSGEVFTGPHERSASGTIRFDVPSGTRGAEVTGAELTFDQGRVVDARADRGEAQLMAALAIDEGARYLGEIGIGQTWASIAPPARPCWTRRSPGPCTWLSAAPIRRRAEPMPPPCTGIWSATCAPGAGSASTVSP
jgi:aminopeptidase